MSTSPSALLLSLTLVSTLAGGVAAAEDLGFRFSESSGRCENQDGQVGLNPGLLGECGDLAGADLGAAQLDGLNLRGADLSRAYLFGASLKRADLRSALLQKAQLGAARLDGADLRGANLNEAYLFSTTLHDADLRGAQLETVRLARTSLRGATFDWTTSLPVPSKRAAELGMVRVGRAR